MVYFSATLISFILFFCDLSLLPHLLPALTIPFLFLPFISIISLKDRTIFPIFLAGIIGFLTDGILVNSLPIFSIAYLTVAIMTKVFFERFSGYGELRANIINLFSGLTIIYIPIFIQQFTTISSLSWGINLIFNILANFVVLFLYLWAGQKYFLWVERKTEERFR